MKLRIVKHRKAARDVLQIFLHIGEDNLDAARRFLHALDDDFHKLAEMPRMGARREFRHPKLLGLRSWPISGFRNYLIFYRVTKDELQVLRVIHGARDLEPALLG